MISTEAKYELQTDYTKALAELEALEAQIAERQALVANITVEGWYALVYGLATMMSRREALRQEVGK